MAAISEREAFLMLVNANRTGRDAARALALLRNNKDWVRIAAFYDQINDKVVKMIDRKERAN